MLSRATVILCATILIAGCNKKSEPTGADTKSSTAPATSSQSKKDAVTTAEGPIKAGANYGTFRATSPTALKLAKGTTLTATPEGEIVAFRINDGTGGSIRCQRDSGCTGACTWETSRRRRIAAAPPKVQRRRPDVRLFLALRTFQWGRRRVGKRQSLNPKKLLDPFGRATSFVAHRPCALRLDRLPTCTTARCLASEYPLDISYSIGPAQYCMDTPRYRGSSLDVWSLRISNRGRDGARL
jgi:hypothetical protein